METITTTSRRRSKAIVKRNYFGRIVVNTIILLVVIPEFFRLDSPLIEQIYISFYCLAFPHIAYLLAKNNAKPQKAEIRNMMIEGFCFGNFIVMTSFSLWPIIAVLSPQIIYIGFYGGLRYYIQALGFMILGILVFVAFKGFHVDFISSPLSTYIAVICTPLMILGLVVQIRTDYERSRNKIRKNKEHLEQLSTKLAKYLSRQVYNQIFLGKKEVKLESYRKKLTIFFSDIVGFTHLTDNMEAEMLSFLLNDYFNEMSIIAEKHEGTIDKFMGDAIMIFFGDPESNGEKEDALACVGMALEMRSKMKFLRQRWDQQGISKALHIRMGINTGFCTVGNFGSEDRMDYTIVGGQVNLASRLEGRSETDEILISHETYSLIKDQVICEKKTDLILKGIALPVKTYQIVGFKDDLQNNNHKIKEEHIGFALAMDLNSVEQDKAIVTLKNALRTLEEVKEQVPRDPL